jgi:large repetitive protein
VTGGLSPESYAYSGLPAGCASADSPILHCTPSAPGNSTVHVTVRDQAGETVEANVSVDVFVGLAVVTFAAEPSAIELGEMTVFAANVTGGAGSDSFAYSSLPPGCRAVNASTLPCAPTSAGNFSSELVVTDRSGMQAYAAAALSVASRLTIGAASADPAEVELGGATVLSATLDGGLGVRNVSWSDLPPGCAPGPATSLSCTPSETGTFLVEVAATDDHGGAASANLSLTVVPALRIVSFSATALTVPLGGTTNLSVVLAGGVGPDAYRFLDLPPGCPGANASRIACTPSQSGTYPVEVVVRDAAGRVVSANLTLEVAAPPLSVTPLAGLSSVDLLAWVAVVGVAVVGFVVLLRRRRPTAPPRDDPDSPEAGDGPG